MTIRTLSDTLPTVALRSTGDFDAVWRDMAQADHHVWTIAQEPLPDLFSCWEPRIDLTEQDDAYFIRAELPGIQRDDMTVEYRDGVLTVKGEQTIETGADHETHRVKHGYRAFTRRFVLSEPVAANAMAVIYTHDGLEVHLPKAVEVAQFVPVHTA